MNERERERAHQQHVRRRAVACLVRAADALLDDVERAEHLAAALLSTGNAIMLIARLDPDEKAREMAEKVLHEIVAQKGGETMDDESNDDVVVVRLKNWKGALHKLAALVEGAKEAESPLDMLQGVESDARDVERWLRDGVVKGA